MEDKNKIIKSIKDRYSVRTYDGAELPKDLIASIRDYLARDFLPPFSSEVRFKLIEVKDLDKKDLKKIGTYGFIKGAKYYIVGSVKENDKHLEDFGYVFENIILKMTRLGLGTCWLGGTFKKQGFRQLMNCSEKESIPAVSPLGFSTKKKGIRDKIMRGLARSSTRTDWESIFFTEKNQGLSREQAGDYAEPLDMLRLSPSSSNSQPWRIFMDKEKTFDFCIKSRNANLKDSKRIDLKRIDIGIAMYHFAAVSEAKGLKGSWTIKDEDRYQKRGLRYVCSWVTKE